MNWGSSFAKLPSNCSRVNAVNWRTIADLSHVTYQHHNSISVIRLTYLCPDIDGIRCGPVDLQFGFAIFSDLTYKGHCMADIAFPFIAHFVHFVQSSAENINCVVALLKRASSGATMWGEHEKRMGRDHLPLAWICANGALLLEVLSRCEKVLVTLTLQILEVDNDWLGNVLGPMD